MKGIEPIKTCATYPNRLTSGTEDREVIC